MSIEKQLNHKHCNNCGKKIPNTSEFGYCPDSWVSFGFVNPMTSKLIMKKMECECGWSRDINVGAVCSKGKNKND